MATYALGLQDDLKGKWLSFSCGIFVVGFISCEICSTRKWWPENPQREGSTPATATFSLTTSSSFRLVLPGSLGMPVLVSNAHVSRCTTLISHKHISFWPKHFNAIAMKTIVLILICLAPIPSAGQSGIVIDPTLRAFFGTLEPYVSGKNDIVFVLDASGSIGSTNFPHEVKFAELVSRMFTVAPGKVAILLFLKFQLNFYFRWLRCCCFYRVH